MVHNFLNKQLVINLKHFNTYPLKTGGHYTVRRMS